MKKLFHLLHLFLLVFLLANASTRAKEIPPKPNRLVNDYAGVLAASDKAMLENILVNYFDSTSTQIAIVIEPSLEGDDLFDYCQRLATAWGIGEKGKNNGALIYVAINDRKVRIHVGYGLEPTIPDALASRIINEQIKPNFKKEQYAQGLLEAVTVMMKAASGEFVNDREQQAEEMPWWVWIIFILFILLVIWGKGGGGRRGYSRWGGPVYWGGTFGSGGFSSGKSFGGGFGGFGGGGFGGGGSSGSW